MGGGVSKPKVYVSIKGIKNDNSFDPYFNVKRGKSETRLEWIDGYLSNIRFKKFTGSDNEDVPTVAITLLDDGEEWILESTYTVVARGIWNALLNITDFSKKVKIEIYGSNNLAKTIITLGGVRLDWKFRIKPKDGEKRIDGHIYLGDILGEKKPDHLGKLRYDFTELNRFFYKELYKLQPKLEGTPEPIHDAPPISDDEIKKAENNITTSNEKGPFDDINNNENPNPELDDDDLPF